MLADACRHLDVPVVRRARQPRLAPEPDARGRRGADRRGRPRARAELDRLDVRGTRGRRRRAEGLRRRLPRLVLPDFGEPLLRQVYAETTPRTWSRSTGARGGRRLRLRIVLLHYAPTTTTLEGEPRGIWAFLGSDRLAGPIAEHRPTSFCTVTRTRGRSRASSAACPSTTSRSRSPAATSGSSSSAATSARRRTSSVRWRRGPSSPLWTKSRNLVSTPVSETGWETSRAETRPNAELGLEVGDAQRARLVR